MNEQTLEHSSSSTTATQQERLLALGILLLLFFAFAYIIYRLLVFPHLELLL